MKNKQIYSKIITFEKKRKELILKILGQLFKGQIGNLLFKKGLIYKTNYYENYNYMKRCNEERRQQTLYADFDGLKEELLKNIHDIAKKLNKENLSLLEFLINKIDIYWNIDITARTDKRFLQNLKKELTNDIQEIKNRCANYLLLMQIEENN